MNNPYHDFVSGVLRLLETGKTLPLGGFATLPRPDLPDGAPRVLLFSPHPDDEVIIGGLALRLMRESGRRIINVAVTQGSLKPRQAARWEELRQACEHIGFELMPTHPNGLEKINMEGKRADPDNWKGAVDRIAEILREQGPEILFFPHDDDFNTTHIGTHHLVVEALQKLGDISCWVVETEFWGAMKNPNLMVEIPPADVADLLSALSFHAGEVRRNPYHLRMPGWLIDNVRRGGEVVGGQGGAAPDFPFATLYRLRRWEKTGFRAAFEGGKVLSASENPASLFKN